MTKNKCCVDVSDDVFTGLRSCRGKPWVEIDGLWYCRIHDPKKVKERADKASKKYADKWAKGRVELAGPEMLSLLKAIQKYHAINPSFATLVIEVDEIIEKVEGVNK